MNYLSDTGRIKLATGRAPDLRSSNIHIRSPQRLTGLIHFGFNVLNGLIVLQFLLKLIGANSANPFVDFIYTITAPFLRAFQSPALTWSIRGVEFEFFAWIAIAVYTLIGLIIIDLIWLLYYRRK
jgi:uncharacterized protein YggT (Ycf19 family)